MAETRDLSPAVRAFLSVYRWRRIDPIPFSRLRKPISQSNVGIVSTAGFSTVQQQPFDDAIRGGDTSFRIIGSETDLSTLANSHRSESFDHSGMIADPNLALPIGRLRELESDRTIGSMNRRHLSFMGSITRVEKLVQESAPAAADLFVADGVDVAFLVPV